MHKNKKNKNKNIFSFSPSNNQTILHKIRKSKLYRLKYKKRKGSIHTRADTHKKQRIPFLFEKNKTKKEQGSGGGGELKYC